MVKRFRDDYQVERDFSTIIRGLATAQKVEVICFPETMASA
jgi:hypothetical protein